MTDKPAPVQNPVEQTIAIKPPLAEATSFVSGLTVDSVPGDRLRQAAGLFILEYRPKEPNSLSAPHEYFQEGSPNQE